MPILGWWPWDAPLQAAQPPSLQETQHVLGLDLPHSQFLEKGKNWKTGLALPPSSPRGSDIWFLGPDRLCWSVQVLPATV